MASHILFLARVSESAAERLYIAYRDTLGLLAENPQGLPRYEPISKTPAQLHVKIFAKRYRIVFELRDQSVFVYDIQDCRQDTDKNLV